MNELVKISKTDVMDLFSKRELITPLLEAIEIKALGLDRDVTTCAGRKSISAMAYRVAQSKTYIESHGKEIAAELKALPKVIDSNRKFAKDFLDDLKARVREPLTKWEDEQEKIKLQKKILEDHKLSLIDNSNWDLKKKEEQARLEKERFDYEAKVLAEARVQAILEADEMIRLEKLKADTAIIVAQENSRQAEEKAKRDIETAKQEAIAAEIMKQEEIRKIKAVEQIRIEAAKNNKENIERVDASIVEDFTAVGLNEKQARYIIAAIRDGKIRGVEIV